MTQKTLRLKKELRNTGILCLLGFLAIGTFSVVASLVAPPPKAQLQPIHMATFFGLFWGAWSCLAIWILLAYRRERLTVNSESVIQRGVIRTQVIRFDEIDTLIWKPAPTQARLIAGTTKMKIHFTNFDKPDQLWLIRNLQQQVPTFVQENWEMFCVKAAVPLSKLDTSCLAPGHVAVTRKRWACYFIPATLLFAVVGIVLSLTLKLPRMLIAPFPILILWALLHFSTPSNGLAAPRIDVEPEGLRFLLFLLVWGGVGFAGGVILFALNPTFPPPSVWLAVGGTIWFSVLMFKAVQLDHLRQGTDKERISAALKQWSEVDSPS